MTLTQLEYVLAVAQYKHFGKAAESCFVTQPTLSMQIQKLEDLLQLTLFDRSKSPVTLTDEGQKVVEQARVIIIEQKKLLSMVEEAKKGVFGDFKLAVIPTLSPYIIPLFVPMFIKKYPKVNLQVVENNTEEIIDLLKNGNVDAGLLATPLSQKKIEEKVLYYEPFYLFVNKKHPLSKKKKIKEDELNLDEIWLLNKGNCFRDQVLNICEHSKKSESKSSLHFESGNFETLKNMVLQSDGYTVLPYMCVEQLSAVHKKLIRPFTSPMPTREISIVTHTDCVKKKIASIIEQEILGLIPDELRNIKKKDLQIIEL